MKAWRTAGFLLALLCLASFVIGYALGDPSTVFRKAATVCLECIGVG
ncbi:MAG TPA: CD1871A family CXXC motif-containing protein [Candidatus Fermentibacter sp.]|nr:CD1871A family CXXC motif-containing protein [Candidatus Fermentibacter sp.]